MTTKKKSTAREMVERIKRGDGLYASRKTALMAAEREAKRRGAPIPKVKKKGKGYTFKIPYADY